MDDLEDLLRPVQVPEPVTTEVNEIDERRECLAYEVGSRLRAQHLPGVRDAHQPRGSVERWAEVVTVALFRLAGVHPNPDRERTRLAPLLTFDRALRLDRRDYRLGRIREHCVHPIARHLDDEAAVPLDRAAQDRVVTRQRLSHRVAMLLPQTRRTLQIREQEGDRPRRQLAHHPKCPIRTTRAPPAGSRSSGSIDHSKDRPEVPFWDTANTARACRLHSLIECCFKD